MNPLHLDRRDVNRRAHLPVIDDLKFKAPFTCIISGPSGSGKSTFVFDSCRTSTAFAQRAIFLAA